MAESVLGTLRPIEATVKFKWCGHWSDCAVHNEPAYPNGPCSCGRDRAARNPITALWWIVGMKWYAFHCGHPPKGCRTISRTHYETLMGIEGLAQVAAWRYMDGGPTEGIHNAMSELFLLTHPDGKMRGDFYAGDDF